MVLAEAFNRGVELHRAGRLKEAEASYREILNAQPEHFDALQRVGVIEKQKGNDAEAVRLIQAALKIQPRSPSALANLGLALHHLGRHAEALASYDKATALKPDDADAWYNRGNVLRDLERQEEALRNYDQAISIRPEHAEALNNRGSALKTLKRYDEAQASCEKALSVDPGRADALALLFEIKGRCCDWDDRGAQLDKLAACYASGEPLAPFGLLWAVDSPELHLEASRAWAREIFLASGPKTACAPRQHPRLRIAYVSAD